MPGQLNFTSLNDVQFVVKLEMLRTSASLTQTFPESAIASTKIVLFTDGRPDTRSEPLPLNSLISILTSVRSRVVLVKL